MRARAHVFCALKRRKPIESLDGSMFSSMLRIDGTRGLISSVRVHCKPYPRGFLFRGTVAMRSACGTAFHTPIEGKAFDIRTRRPCISGGSRLTTTPATPNREFCRAPKLPSFADPRASRHHGRDANGRTMDMGSRCESLPANGGRESLRARQ